MRLASLTLWLLVLSLSSVSSAVADYLTSFGNGVQALEKEQWSEAADWFRKAIEEKPQAGGKISVSGQRQPYLPHYQLGLALYRAGKLRAASDAWRESALHGALSKKRRELVEQYLFDIEARLEEQFEEVGEPEVELERELSAEEVKVRQKAARRQLDRAANQIQKLAAPDLRAILEADPSLAAGRDLGIEKLSQARQIFDTAGVAGDPIALQEVHARAVDAAGRLEQVVLSATMALPPEQQAEAVAVPPDFLRDAASALFSGRYDDVLAVLAKGDLGDIRVRKHAHLFRAAALYALYLLGDRQDATRLQAAEAEARACRAIDPGLAPPSGGFSPNFVRFFESMG